MAITGCLYAFQEEISDALEPYRFTEVQEKKQISASQFFSIAKRILPDKSLHSIKYLQEGRSAQAIYYRAEPFHYLVAYINPYTGEVLHIHNMKDGFFRWVLNGHFYLWLPEKIGQTTVAISTLVFLFSVISGLILWFPKNKHVLSQRFWFRWKKDSSWKRKNFDWHSITGFYTCLFSLAFIFTGLVWGFQWYAYSYYTVLGGEKSLVFSDPASQEATVIDSSYIIFDVLHKKIQNETSNVVSTELHLPEDSLSAIAVNLNYEEGTYWKTDYRYFDRKTLKELDVNHIYGKLENANNADLIMRMNYDIHTGAILGLPGKILACFVSLLIAGLPVSGFLIWYGRKKRKRISMHQS